MDSPTDTRVPRLFSLEYFDPFGKYSSQNDTKIQVHFSKMTPEGSGQLCRAETQLQVEIKIRLSVPGQT